MPKRIPPCPDLDKLQRGRSGEARTYHIELITPLFGGGVAAGENDPTMPIRGTAIRGQLQFWWRATRGGLFGTLGEMCQRHEELFGSSEFPSPLEVIVSEVEGIASADSVRDFQRFGAEAYALFPAIDKRSKLLKEGLRFKLELRWPNADRLTAMREAQNNRLVAAGSRPLPATIGDLAPDIIAAMWGWVNFGGLGARTRRGCGALLCKDFAPASAGQVRDWFGQHSVAHLEPVASGRRDWSRLPRAIYTRTEPRAALYCWNFLLSIWKEFRQGPDTRDPGHGGRPGRSYYPEPETIREMLGRRSPRHPRLDNIPADAFPRAELGLPIVFQFQGNEVPKTTLHPIVDGERKERMASPLILKPLALANGQAVPIIVPLVTPGVSEVELMQGDQPKGRKGIHAIRHHRLAEYPKSPLVGLSDQGSALEAFVNFARRPAAQDGPGFEEIAQ
jgi:CRISPR-associated protein Cmr1